MNYDLHKAGGDPGPNFPLSGNEIYGTDLTESLPQFLSFIPANKITMTYGLYGYDWIVDENKHPLQNAKALPLVDITKHFIDTCAWRNCTVQRDPKSHETEIDYIDSSLLYHVIWFEDKTSVKDKMDFAKTKGIVDSAIWIYGYY
jgi:spore germination protein YaaH